VVLNAKDILDFAGANISRSRAEIMFHALRFAAPDNSFTRERAVSRRNHGALAFAAAAVKIDNNPVERFL
jgi:hypothetical protein